MTALGFSPLEGGCSCRAARYRLLAPPMFVNCCHCRWCQRETGSAFVINAVLETTRVLVLSSELATIDTPSESGAGQQIVRCARCEIALWSHYAGAGSLAAFVRVGTLDTPAALAPGAHIFTASKQPWVVLPPGVPAFAEYYDANTLWPAESLARRAALLAR
jgi:hypothetical protein